MKSQSSANTKNTRKFCKIMPRISWKNSMCYFLSDFEANRQIKLGAQCENCWIFCKSDFTWNQFWGLYKFKNALFCSFSSSEFLLLVNFSHQKKCKNSLKSKLSTSKNIKVAGFWSFIIPTIEFHVISECQKNSEIYTLWSFAFEILKLARFL